MQRPLWICGRVVWLLCACAVLLPRLAAAGEPSLAVDFDGDGRRDRVTLDQHRPTLLQIWLSASNTSQVLHSCRPLRRLVAADLDGDHRAELIAHDSASKIHVWIHGRKGFLKYRRHHRVPSGLTSPARRDVCGNDAVSETLERGAASSPSALVRTASRGPSVNTVSASAVHRSQAYRVFAAVSHLAPRPPPASLPL